VPLEDCIQCPAVFALQAPQEFQPPFDGFQPVRVEREAVGVIAQGQCGILEPVIELVHLLPGEFQGRIDLSDLADRRGCSLQFRED
jgi:hypothetical protein